MLLARRPIRDRAQFAIQCRALVVRPYVGLPLFGKTLIWKRVAAKTGRN